MNDNINYITNQTCHNYESRQRNTYIHYAQKYPQFRITKVLNTFPIAIEDKKYTHSS